MEIMKEILPKDYFIHLHCFTEGWMEAQEWMIEFPNLFIGFSNSITYGNSVSTQIATKKIPLDRFLIETETPYFLPKKSTRTLDWSHPGMAIYVAFKMAALREMPLADILYWARKNTLKMYGI